jgi:hypothetical protein
MALALVYDPRYHTFESWASLMVEAYGGQQLEIPNEGTDWKGWAAGLKGIDIFVNDAAPDPYIYDNWDDWAAQLVNTVNQRVK